MKRICTAFLAALLVLACFVPASAQELDIAGFTLPQPETPDHFVYYPGEGEEGCDALSVITTVDKSVAKLAQEYWEDAEGFCEQRGLASFRIALQYDVSLDGTDNWQHTTAWDTKHDIGGSSAGYTYASLDGSLMETVELFWLTYHAGNGTDTFEAYQPAILSQQHTDGEYQWDTYYFDHENHSLYIRCRYIMVWYLNDGGEYSGPYSSIGPWSQYAVFGQGSTQVIPDAPEGYEAPVISKLELYPQDEDTEYACLTYVQDTPKSVWDAEVYYSMVSEGGFEGLETQISIDGGDWQEVYTDDSTGSLCLKNGLRTVTGNDDLILEKTSDIKLRVRFVGTDGTSEWSNELYLEGVEEDTGTLVDEGEVENPTNLWWILWVAIGVAVIAAVVIVVIVLKKRKK